MASDLYLRPLLDKKEAAKLLDLSVSFLDHDRCGLKSIPFVDLSKPGAIRKTIKYDPVDLSRWLDERRHGTPRVNVAPPAPPQPPPVRRGPGRPKGSKNRRRYSDEIGTLKKAAARA